MRTPIPQRWTVAAATHRSAKCAAKDYGYNCGTPRGFDTAMSSKDFLQVKLANAFVERRKQFTRYTFLEKCGDTNALRTGAGSEGL